MSDEPELNSLFVSSPEKVFTQQLIDFVDFVLSRGIDLNKHCPDFPAELIAEIRGQVRAYLMDNEYMYSAFMRYMAQRNEMTDRSELQDIIYGYKQYILSNQDLSLVLPYYKSAENQKKVEQKPQPNLKRTRDEPLEGQDEFRMKVVIRDADGNIVGIKDNVVKSNEEQTKVKKQDNVTDDEKQGEDKVQTKKEEQGERKESEKSGSQKSQARPTHSRPYKKVKCSFYPNCTRDNCTFFHPKQNCKFFPKCKFGQRCIYIHPPCRYGSKCTNRACNYTHPKVVFKPKEKKRVSNALVCRPRPFVQDMLNLFIAQKKKENLASKE